MTSKLTQITDSAVANASKQIAAGNLDLRGIILMAVQAGMADAYDRGIEIGKSATDHTNLQLSILEDFSIEELTEGLDYIYPRDEWNQPIQASVFKDDLNKPLYNAVASFFKLGQLKYKNVGMGRTEITGPGFVSS